MNISSDDFKATLEEVYVDKNLNVKNINRRDIEKYDRHNEHLKNPKFLFEISRSSRMQERLQEKLKKRRAIQNK